MFLMVCMTDGLTMTALVIKGSNLSEIKWKQSGKYYKPDTGRSRCSYGLHRVIMNAELLYYKFVKILICPP